MNSVAHCSVRGSVIFTFSATKMTILGLPNCWLWGETDHVRKQVTLAKLLSTFSRALSRFSDERQRAGSDNALLKSCLVHQVAANFRFSGARQ